MSETLSVIERLLSGPAAPADIADITAWWTRHEQATDGYAAPIHRAMLGGFVADRLGYAFASGYREALCLAVPDVGGDKLALCATEKGGAHPRAIATRLDRSDADNWRLTGAKEYASLGSFADGYIVIASVGQREDGRNQLVAVRLPKGRAGIAVHAMPPTPMVPEVPHARLTFDEVAVAPDEVLPGDGYSRYLKPFRTIEDIHVQAAFCAYIVQVARRGTWPQPLLEQLLAVLWSLANLGLVGREAGASDSAVATGAAAVTQLMRPCTHIALAGVQAQLDAALHSAEPHWAEIDQDTQRRWQRDRTLLGIAGKARARRREAAWQRLDRAAIER